MLRLFAILLFPLVSFVNPAFAEDISVPVKIVQTIDGKTQRLSGVLTLKNFPKNEKQQSLSLKMVVTANGKVLCTGKLTTQGYQAYFSSKCGGKSYRGNGTINRTINIGGRKINFIRKVKMKSGKSIIEVTT